MTPGTPQTAQALSLILEQCARVGTAVPRSTAATRLEQRVGERLARLLVSALSGDHRRVGVVKTS